MSSFINFMIQLHSDTIWIVLALGAATLLCGLFLLFRWRAAGAGANGNVPPAGPLRLFRRLLAVTAAIGALQALFGGIIYLGGGPHPGDNLHFVYGLIVLAAIPVAYVYSDQKQVRRDIIIMTIAVLAIVGAAVRAFMTGAP